MTSSMVTILIPTYARTATLQEALWCAVNQTIPAEIIVLNDCPQQELICSHPLVKVVNLSERIATLGKKRNTLLELAETEWVTWLDDDDWLLPWYIEDLTKTFSQSLDAILANRCWHPTGGSSDGMVHWQRGTAPIATAVRLRVARAIGGFPVELETNEDMVFRAQLIARERSCSLLMESGYCYRWDNEIYHTSGLGDVPLAAARFGREADIRFNQGLEPSGRIVLSPSLRHDYFKNCPERRSFGANLVVSAEPQDFTLQQTIAFAGQVLRLIYPPGVAKIIAQVFEGCEQGLEGSETSSLIVKYNTITGRFAIELPEHAAKTNIPAHDLGQQLLLSANTVLLNHLTAGLPLYAGAVAKGKKGILLPGVTGAGKSFLTAWLLGKSCSFLTDSLVCIQDGGKKIQGLPQPFSFKRSANRKFEQLFATESSRTEIIEGSATDLVPWRMFTSLDKTEEEVSANLLLFPEFRPGADLSLEALSPAQATLMLLANVANAHKLPANGFPNAARICKNIPSLRLIYGDTKQLDGVLERVIAIIFDYDLTPGDFVTLTAPFNRSRRIDELVPQSTAAPTTMAPLPVTVEAAKSTVPTYPIPEASLRGPKKKLTIGMATYDDFDGVYFSVQALRIYHPEIVNEIEILVIDNHPGGPCSAALKKLDLMVPGYRYVPEKGTTGTAVRDVIFREACGEFVLCMDCHVFIFPGVLQQLLTYLDAQPECHDLLQGPLIYDDLKTISTHFQPVWRNGMYGVWATDERGCASNAEPFDIPMQGLGLFCCRRDTWPGFNPRFRGFGGEEGYIHEKFRQNGGRALCLPFLRWLHRFERPMGVPYKNKWEDRIYNYMVGFQELGLETQTVEDHFSELLGKEPAQRIFDSVQKEMHSPFFFFDAIYCITSDGASEQGQSMLARLINLGIADRVQVIQAVTTPDNQHISCALSHRRLIAEAERRNLKNILIFGDDTIFPEDTLQLLTDSVEELKKQDWHIFYVGERTSEQSFPLADRCSVLRRPRGLIWTQALAYSSSIYKELLDVLPKEAVDMTLWIKENKSLGEYLQKLDKLFVASTVEPIPPQDESAVFPYAATN